MCEIVVSGLKMQIKVAGMTFRDRLSIVSPELALLQIADLTPFTLAPTPRGILPEFRGFSGFHNHYSITTTTP
jgi:hypothetical protein